jgi:hypothetical protein
MLRFGLLIIGLDVLIGAGQFVHAQARLDTREKHAPKRITIDNLVTAAPLPDEYEVARHDIREGDKLLGHKLTLTRAESVSKVIVSVERRKVVRRQEKVAAASAYVSGIVQSFRAAGLRPVAKEIPEIGGNDFKKRVTANLVYENPADGSRLLVQIQIFFTDLGHTVLVVSDNEEDHDLLTGWARTVMGKFSESQDRLPR